MHFAITPLFGVLFGGTWAKFYNAPLSHEFCLDGIWSVCMMGECQGPHIPLQSHPNPPSPSSPVASIASTSYGSPALKDHSEISSKTYHLFQATLAILWICFALWVFITVFLFVFGRKETKAGRREVSSFERLRC